MVRFVLPAVNQGLEMTIPCPEETSMSNPARRDSNRGIRRKLDVLFAGKIGVSSALQYAQY